MKFTNNNALAGEKALKELSEKAQWYYDVTDPICLYYDGKIYVLKECGDIIEFKDIKELNEHMESMADYVGYNTVEVEFKGGQSRYGGHNVNYMIADVDGIELYSEIDYDETMEDSDFDDYSYKLLKAEIIKQARYNGINEYRLKFWWD